MWAIGFAFMAMVCFKSVDLIDKFKPELADELGWIMLIAGFVFVACGVYALAVEISLLLNGG
jgi:hypothetical protein